MTYEEFTRRVIGERSVFDRPQFDAVTNAVKWVALRVAYGLYRLGWSANLIDVLGLLLSYIGFVLFATAATGERVLPVLGLLCLYAHIFIDFVDGPVAKVRGVCSPIGVLLDNLGCEIDRFAMLVLLGYFAGGQGAYLLASIFTACVLILFMTASRKYAPSHGVLDRLCRLYSHKYSFLSVRFLLVVFPLGVLAGLWWGMNLSLFARGVVLFYSGLAIVWLIITAFSSQTRAVATESETREVGRQ